MPNNEVAYLTVYQIKNFINWLLSIGLDTAFLPCLFLNILFPDMEKPGHIQK